MIAINKSKMPKSCFECLFRYKVTTNSLGEFHKIDSCFITKEEVFGHLKTRSQNCPLIEINEVEND